MHPSCIAKSNNSQSQLRTKFIPMHPSCIPKSNNSQSQLRTKFIPMHPSCIKKEEPTPTPSCEPDKIIFKNIKTGDIIEIPILDDNILIPNDWIMVTSKPILSNKIFEPSCDSYITPNPIIPKLEIIETQDDLSMVESKSNSQIIESKNFEDHEFPIAWDTPPDLYYNMSGLIVIQNGYKINNKYCQTIFIGLNSDTLKYEIFSGDSYSDESVKNSAFDNCTTASAGMFQFDSNIIDERFCVESDKNIAYVVCVNTPKYGIQNRVFHTNLTRLNNRNHIENITRIGIREAISSGINEYENGDFTMFDVNDCPVIICERDAKLIHQCIKNRLNKISPIYNIRFIKKYNDKTDSYCFQE